MKNSFALLISASLLTFSSGVSHASDKVLSPVNSWEISSGSETQSMRGCILSNNFEDDVTLSFGTQSGFVQYIQLKNSDELFQAGTAYRANIFITPGFNGVFDGIALDTNILEINLNGRSDVTSALKSGFLLRLSTDDNVFNFSLSGLRDQFNKAQNCRSSDWSSNRKIVKFNDVQNTSNSSSNTPVKIDLFVNKDKPKNEAQISETELVMKSEAAVETIENNTSYSEPVLESQEIVENDIVEDVSMMNQEANVKTATRIHKPSVKIQPSDSVAQLDNEYMTEAEVQPMTIDATAAAEPMRERKVFSNVDTEDLIRPPEFDPADIQDASLPQDDETIIASNELGNSSDEGTAVPLARKNDFQQDIYWEDGESVRSQKRLLSQSEEEAIKNPVVIPVMDESPQRIDLMRKDKERTYISNEELERQVKLSQSIQTPASESEIALAQESFQGGVQPEEIARREVIQEVPSSPALPSNMAIAASPVSPVVSKRISVDEEPALDRTPYIMSSEAAQDNVIQSPTPADLRWMANPGDNLRQTLAEWSLSENVEMIWDSNQEFEVKSLIASNDTYEKVVAALLRQYIGQNISARPVGQLFIDPDNGKKVLIVQTAQM